MEATCPGVKQQLLKEESVVTWFGLANVKRGHMKPRFLEKAGLHWQERVTNTATRDFAAQRAPDRWRGEA